MILKTNSGIDLNFHRLKIAKKEILTKSTFALHLEVPAPLESHYRFLAGQYVTVRFESEGIIYEKDYSITSAPFENALELAIKAAKNSVSAQLLLNNFSTGVFLEVSEPRGRFTLAVKPHEFRTIVGFAAGIGITPIISHFKNILHTEPRTRLYLFYGNSTPEETVFAEELAELQHKYPDRLEVHYFYSQIEGHTGFYSGRLDEKKLHIIINQILHLDDTDEEATIWDAVDAVLICGPGAMVKALANACYSNGIPKKNIHFELFEEFNDDIYPVEITFPHLENIDLEFYFSGKNYRAKLADNKTKILQQLLEQKFPVPYSCKSGICGSCICTVESGEVALLENEYLTEQEENSGKTLACQAIALSPFIKLNFDPN